MLYRIEFFVIDRTIGIVTNSKYIADFLNSELINSKVVLVEKVTSYDYGVIEKSCVESEIGVVLTDENIITGFLNYCGNNIPYMKIYNFAMMQSVRVFVNLVVANVFKDICLPLHCSSILMDRQGIGFVGEKNSGKSTLTIGTILWKDAKLVSDDITFFWIDNGNIRFFGLFNGAHMYENEKYMYKNKIYDKKCQKTDMVKKRIIFNDAIIEENAILNQLFFPSIIENEEDCFEIINIGKNEKKELIRDNIIRFNSISYSNEETIVDYIYTHIKFTKCLVGKNFINTIDALTKFV